MHAMTNRERVLRTYRFEPTDRAPVDFFQGMYRLAGLLPVQTGSGDRRGGAEPFRRGLPLVLRGLFGARRGECRRGIPKPLHVNLLRQRRGAPDPQRPDRRKGAGGLSLGRAGMVGRIEHSREAKAVSRSGLVLAYGWMPAFGIACEAFGFENALEKMLTRPDLFAAVHDRQNDFLVALLERLCGQAEGIADICWLGDDYADQRGLIMGADLWRKFIKEPLRRQVEVVHKHGMFALFHSCGALREILPDLIEIGVDALEVFQTTAAGMDPESIARDFGGKIAFVGGIDCQQVLSFGSEEDMRREVRRNVDAFAECGGYVVTNAHIIESIKPENIVAMLSEARDYRPRRRREA